MTAPILEEQQQKQKTNKKLGKTSWAEQGHTRDLL
jgi:hypothetical protein